MSNRVIPLSVQLGKLKHYFPNSTNYMDIHTNRLIWKTTLQPSELSLAYEIKIVYTLGQSPKVYVVSPKPLALADVALRFLHVYKQVKHQLCLYYGPAREWTPDKMIADTIVPWASEWLLHYEFWLVTGIWHGGGIHPR